MSGVRTSPPGFTKWSRRDRSSSQFTVCAILANTPLDAVAPVQALCRRRGIGFVLWIQDLLGIASARILARKIPVLGNLIGAWYVALERRFARRRKAPTGLVSTHSRSIAKENREDRHARSRLTVGAEAPPDRRHVSKSTSWALILGAIRPLPCWKCSTWNKTAHFVTITLMCRLISPPFCLSPLPTPWTQFLAHCKIAWK